MNMGPEEEAKIKDGAILSFDPLSRMDANTEVFGGNAGSNMMAGNTAGG